MTRPSLLLQLPTYLTRARSQHPADHVRATGLPLAPRTMARMNNQWGWRQSKQLAYACLPISQNQALFYRLV